MLINRTNQKELDYQKIFEVEVFSKSSRYLRKKFLKMDFYYNICSSPCRGVLLTAKALDVELNMKEMNLMAGEHMAPEFLKVNRCLIIDSVS